MFEGDPDMWWITGGLNNNAYAMDSTEMYSTFNNSFNNGPNLPLERTNHNLVNVNNTHMVLLGALYSADEIYIYDR